MQVSTTSSYSKQHFNGLTFSDTKVLKKLNSRINNVADMDRFEKIKARANKNDIVDIELFQDKEERLRAFIWQRDPKKHDWTPDYRTEPTINKHTKKSPLDFIEELVAEAEIWAQKIKKNDK